MIKYALLIAFVIAIGTWSVYAQAGGLYFANEVEVQGTTIYYSWYVLNTGSSTASNIEITSNLNPGFTNFQSNNCTLVGNQLTCLIPNLGPGQRYPQSFTDYITWSIDFTGSSTTAPTTYTNSAIVCGDVGCEQDNSIATISQQQAPITCPPGYELVNGICVSIIIPEPDVNVTELAEKVDYLEMEVGNLETEVESIKEVNSIQQQFLDWIDILLAGFYDLLGVRYA